MTQWRDWTFLKTMDKNSRDNSFSFSILIPSATGVLLYGIGSTIGMPALTALIADTSDTCARGRVYSFFYGAFYIGVISAGISLGFLADLF